MTIQKSAVQLVLEKQKELSAIAKQCHIEEIYHFIPNEEMPLSFMADIFFLIIPRKGEMSNTDLYQLKDELEKLFKCSIFVNTENGLKALLDKKILSQDEYELAIKKNNLVMSNLQAVSAFPKSGAATWPSNNSDNSHHAKLFDFFDANPEEAEKYTKDPESMKQAAIEYKANKEKCSITASLQSSQGNRI